MTHAEPPEELTCAHCDRLFARKHPIGRRPTFCPDHNTPAKRASSREPRGEVLLPLETRLQLRATARKVEELVDSIQPNLEPMLRTAEAVRSQLSWLDRTSLGGVEAFNGWGALTGADTMASMTKLEPIGAMFAANVASALSTVKLNVPDWPKPGMIAGLSLFGEQVKIVNDSIAPDLGPNLASMFSTLSENIDLGIASKLADIDTARLFTLLADEVDADGSIADEIADEIDVDRSGLLAARDVLRAVIGLIFDSLSDPDGWARDGAAAFDEKVNTLYDAAGDNPYIWLLGVASTVAWIVAFAQNRIADAREADD